MRMPKSSSFSVRDILDLPKCSSSDTSKASESPVAASRIPPAGDRQALGADQHVRHRQEHFANELRRHQQLKQVGRKWHNIDIETY